ncbi:hypothetical protein EZV62_013492 [Acer yangbiense]|uniref:Uncharacterized protein n=1 Tax=Acer yangbiense TaxID=1000413 RepID=A0A5C7HZP3_9ROSI|nr:hypothetical protein EZV62_013492 [Acer yangbiense]
MKQKDTTKKSLNAKKMWRRSAQLKSLAALWRSSAPPNLRRRSLTSSSPSTTTPSSHRTPPLFPHQVASASDKNLKTKVEDIIPIATGHELEELQAELEGRSILQINHPTGPFGTKEQPAIVKSVYDKRIVGCPGGEEGKLLLFFRLGILSLSDPVHTLKMSMMLFGFGWRKASNMNAQFVLNISCSKWLALEVLLMAMKITIIIDPACSSFLAGMKFE